MTKEQRQHNGAKIVSATRGAGKIGHLHAEGWIWTQTLHPSQKLTQIIVLTLSAHILKLEEHRDD